MPVLRIGVGLLVWVLAAPAAAQSVWEDVIALGQSESEASIQAGLAASGAGDQDEAIAHFEAAVAAAPDNAEAALLLLRERTLAGRYEDVLASTVHLESQPDSTLQGAQALFFRAFALGVTGSYAEGAALLERATRYRSDLTQPELFYGNLAELHMASGNAERAALFYQRALSANSNDVSARLGLASTLLTLGRTEEAEQQLVQAVVSDPEGAFLDQPGVVFLPEGQEHLYRAMIARQLGQQERVLNALARLAETPAASVGQAAVAHLEVGTRSQGAEVTAVSVAGCVPTHAALSPDGERLAVRCEYGGVRETFTNGGGSDAREPTDQYGSYSYTVTDLVYAPDGNTIRVLHSDGGVQPYSRDGSALVPGDRHSYASATLTPQGFVGSDRVLVTGSSSGGFQVIDWDAQQPAPHLSYTPTMTWLYGVDLSNDEGTLTVTDGNTLRVMSGPSWLETASVTLRSGESRFMPYALADDGRELLIPTGDSLVRYSTSTGAPLGLIAVDGLARRIADDPYVGVSLLSAAGPDTYLVGASNAVYVVRLR